jgi:membrane associated rhomboid family serine protease
MSGFYTRPDAFPPVVKNLIIINTLVLLANTLLPQIHLNERMAIYPFISEFYSPYQFLTYMFAHDGLGHLFFNMLGLWMFGARLENIWGSARFLVFYIVCGLVAALANQLIDVYRISHSFDPQLAYIAAQYLSMLGASGAVLGIMAAYAYLFPNTEFILMFPPIPVKAKWLILFYVLADIFGAFSGRDNIAHVAHLGGALAGFIIVLIWNRNNRQRFY